MQRPADIEFHFGGCELFDDVAGVGKRPGQAVKLGNDERVTGAAGGEGFPQSGSVPVVKAPWVAFAALPLLFAVHQLIEALVWAGVNGDVSTGVQQAAALVYVLFAFPVLPTLVPIAVLFLEPRGARLRGSS